MALILHKYVCFSRQDKENVPKICPLFTSKTKIKSLLSVLRYRLPRFRGKWQNQRVAASDVINRSKSIDRTINLFRIMVHSEARARLDILTKIQYSNAWISL